MITPILTDEQVALVREARDLIKDPTHWLQHATAKASQQGPMVDAKDPLATCFCAAGALERVLPDGGNFLHDLYDPLTHVAIRLYGNGLVLVNDRIGHAAVMRVFAVALGEEDV